MHRHATLQHHPVPVGLAGGNPQDRGAVIGPVRRLSAGLDAPRPAGHRIGRPYIIDLEGDRPVAGDRIERTPVLVLRQVRRCQGDLVLADIPPPPTIAVASVRSWLGNDTYRVSCTENS